ncbi:MAG: hypothetical protein WBE41_07025, partial [Terracidiphilus sp.]
MLTQTAQAVAHIQYAAPICAPFFAEKLESEALEMPYVVWLTDYRPESQIQTPTFISSRWTVSPSSFISTELLDWEFGPIAAPTRPSGEIGVTLKYIGRGTP